MKKKKALVISAVNFSEGGPLTILLESLESAAKILSNEWEIIAIVHKSNLIKNPSIKTIEFPKAKKSWLNRLYLEWFVFFDISKKINPEVWLSLHDMTPRIQTRRQAVYCHNPAPFYKINLKEAWLEPKFALFNLLYLILYGINIHKNHAVIVQQSWLRNEFQRIFSHSNIIVAHPNTNTELAQNNYSENCIDRYSLDRPLVLFYPALPRVFKNMDIVCEAMKLLPSRLNGVIELQLTINGDENSYSKLLKKRYSGLPGIKFIGRQNREEMDARYKNCDVVVFPSKLETWGLPISEAKSRHKPLLVADLPYAHETVGDYNAVNFLPTDDPLHWANVFIQIAEGKWKFCEQHLESPNQPFAVNWDQLWIKLTKEL